ILPGVHEDDPSPEHYRKASIGPIGYVDKCTNPNYYHESDAGIPKPIIVVYISAAKQLHPDSG
ncbi:hypothetical protein PQX77_002779, partial [Marasmius sp. AFHP31]